MESLIKPNITAAAHIISPAVPELFDLPGPAFTTPIILNIKPMAAKGMFIQLYAPRQGINPTIIPINENIPQIKPMICICFYLINEINLLKS
jgi:hypothetical protein